MESFWKFSLFASFLSALITFFYIKLTGKDDRNLHKQVFRVCVLVLVSNATIHYLMNNGKDKILTEPFFS